VALLAASAFVPACFSTVSQERMQRLEVRTEPPGAEITLVTPHGTEPVGPAPTTLERRHTVRRSVTSWATPVLGALALAGGIALCAYGAGWKYTSGPMEGSMRTEAIGLLIPGVVLASLGATLVPLGIWGLTNNHREELVPKPEDLRLTAALAGYRPAETAVKIPGPSGAIKLRLVPDGRVAPAVHAPPRRAPRPGGFLPGSPQPTAFALIVGVEKYREAPAAAGARADAERFKALATTTLGIPERNVRLLLDDAVTKTDIEAELDWLKANVRAGGRIYFFFSGHGAADGAAAAPYLVPSTGRPAALGRTAINLDELLRALADTPAREVFAFVDAGFAGTGARTLPAAGAPPGAQVQLAPPAKVALLAATTGADAIGSDAAATGGLFTRHLLEGLGTARADANGDGQISLQELADHVQPRVANEAKARGGVQRPTVAAHAGLGALADLIVAFGLATR
jgi:hypothetical protein